jgi:hypothetical protein
VISPLERSFDQYAKLAKLPAAEAEFRFAAAHVGLGPGLRARLAAIGLRDWRFDRAWIERSVKVYVELQGGVWTAGRHSRGAGYTSDLEKANAATLLGWRGLFFTSQMLKADPMGCMEKVRSLLHRP